MTDASSFDKIRIGIASPGEIRAWSCGEVKKPETINYRTFKPERDGLFCERIFGPVKDWECHCGRYKKVKFKGIVCDRCGVEVTRSKVRRERMGHIELAAPVCHIWYLKGVPSPLSLILDISPKPLEKVLYFASFIVTKVDRARINSELEDIRRAVSAEIESIEEQKDTNIATARRSATKALKEASVEEVEEAPEDVVEDIGDEAIAEPLEDVGELDEDVDEAEELGEEAIPEISAAEKQKEIADLIRIEERDAIDRTEELMQALKLLETAEKRQLVTEDQYRGLERLMDMLSARLGRDMSGMIEAGLGAAAIRQLLMEIDLEQLARELRQEISNTQGAKRARAIKRLEVAEAFIASKSRPEWMILDAVPVISPELRPMVQLDGGRFATSDLNDLYRRIINRNNRLKKIIEIRAPESIVNHEKRLLQEAVDALIDNGRRTRPVVGSNNRPLKSLSDMLKGKEGRFRKNLLGKRVDYSGRSVIVVGPNLKLHQCGLPREMALELFKPFVMKALVEKQYTSNIKTAKRMIDKMRPEVWDALEEVIRQHPVLLNRAPTLHRLGIQAFDPVLVDGKAIQVHPLVCHAFNADFDGDQMAVHVPLSTSAQAEARILMLSSNNLFSPADGHPVVSPVQDIVLGSYYLTQKTDVEPFPEPFKSADEAILAHDTGKLDLHQPIRVRITDCDGTKVRETTVGRLILNRILPEGMPYVDKSMDKKAISELIEDVHRRFGSEATIKVLDEFKTLGFKYATKAGVTISMTDMDIPAKREEIIHNTETAVDKTNQQYRRGLITQGERKQKVLELWTKASEDVATAILENIDTFNPIYMITDSGARGSAKQITQLSGMRGLMSDPFGNLIEDLPIKSNFHEGLSVLEYFISTHGARKGLADTALRTADAGYLTRRLVDVAQDVIVRDIDCGTNQGIYVSEIVEEGDVIETLADRIRGRYMTEPVVDPNTGEVLVDANEEVSDDMAKRIMQAGVKRVGIRSPLTCELRQGICSHCYGRDMALGHPVDIGVAVGIIAAQSIGEPGTQLTMRTFHTGGVAGKYLTGVAEVKKKKQESLRELHDDIRRGLVSFEEGTEGGVERERVRAVQAVLKVLEDQVRGLLRVVELFEARKPKGQAIITESAGKVVDIETKGLKRVVIHSTVSTEVPSAIAGEVLGEAVLDDAGNVAFEAGTEVSDKIARKIRDMGVEQVVLRKTHLVPYRGNLEVNVGDEVEAGDRLTEGPLDPQKVLELRGVRGVMDYLVREIQSVYKSQGVSINDKHVEVIVRQMLKKRKIRNAGDTRFLPGQIVDKFEFEDENARVRALDPPGTEATADWVLLGITEASLATDSFLSAASFQKTTRVLTDAAVKGKRDNLVGLKENVIIGRLIPAGTGLPSYRAIEVDAKDGRFRLEPEPASEIDELLPAGAAADGADLESVSVEESASPDQLEGTPEDSSEAAI